jgi:hypothetical protein
MEGFMKATFCEDMLDLFWGMIYVYFVVCIGHCTAKIVFYFLDK